MSAFDKVIPLFKAKGWHLYRGRPRTNFPAIVMQGRATTIERGTFYHVLPATLRDESFDEVAGHLSFAHQSNQLPTYNDRANPPSIVRGVLETDDGFAIVPADDDNKGSQFHGYEFDLLRIEDAVKFNISNYNIHYFESIDEMATFVVRNKITPQLSSQLPHQTRWSFAHRDANPEELVIYPDNPSPILFRGQNRRFEPCHATITRGLRKCPRNIGGLPTAEQAAVILNLVKVQWFAECLRETPAFHWMEQQKIYLDETAVAQHYGLPTGYIDLSQSFDVSAFFACCEYNKHHQKWSPVGSGEGVVYVLDQRLLPLGMGPKPICMQPFPRPSEQWGWVHELTLGDDFDSQPYVKKFIFKQNLQASQRVFEKFDRGGALFPPDPLATVADKILASSQVPLNVALKTIQGIVKDPLGLYGESTQDVVDMIEREARVTISTAPDSILDDKVQAEMHLVWNQRKGAFLNGVGYRLTRSNPSSIT